MIKYIRENKFIIFIVIISSIMRLSFLDKFPHLVNQDEAFSVYESYSMLKTGMDTWGYKYPMYLIAWGSGMNALQSYIMMPFVAILGLNIYSMRLPQAILSIFTIMSIYGIAKNLYGKKTANIASFLICFSPWHILMSRWGLESNIFIPIFSFALYFLVKGIDKNKYLPLFSLFLGLSLYCYSLMWIPTFLFFIFISSYIIFCKKRIETKFLISSIIVLFITVIPCILFMLVNYLSVPEIRLGIISIPKLRGLRTSEIGISLHRIFSIDIIIDLYKYYFLHWDLEYVYYMLYHYLFLIFPSLISIYAIIKNTKSFVISLKNRIFTKESIIFIGNLVSFLSFIYFVPSKACHTNFCHLFSILMLSFGLSDLIFSGSKIKRLVSFICSICLLISFSIATHYFVLKHKNITEYAITYNVDKAIDYINSHDKNNQKICIDADNILYPVVLYADSTDPDIYRNTVVRDHNTVFSYIQSFGKYTFKNFSLLSDFSDNMIYISSDIYEKKFLSQGFKILNFDKLIVAYKNPI